MSTVDTNMGGLIQWVKGAKQFIREGVQEGIVTVYLTKHTTNYARSLF